MLFIYQSRPISISWTIRPQRGHSPLAQSPALKVLLWDGSHRYLINPTIIDGNTLSFSIPDNLPIATYGLYTIWIDRLRPGTLSLNGHGFQDMVMRSVVRDVFALVSDPTSESNIIRTVLPTAANAARLTLTSHAHPFGPDALDAYEIAVLRGNGDDEALWLERLQEALLNLAALPADYITGDVNADGTADAADTAAINNLLTQNSLGVLRPGDHLHAALTKLDTLAAANHLTTSTLQKQVATLSDRADKADSTDAALQQSISDLSDLSDKSDAALQQSISDLSDKSDLADSAEAEARKEADSVLQAQISGETQTTSATEDVYNANLLLDGLVPADASATRTYLTSLGGTNMAGPIAMSKGDTITTSLSTIAIYRVWRDGDNKIQENCTIEKEGTGSYTATEDMEVLLFDTLGLNLADGDTMASYTLTHTQKSLTTRISELEALVSTQANQIASLQAALTNLSNVSYTISTDDDQDPTT